MLTLICGLPRAGKTTFSSRYTCKVLHLDEFGAFSRAYSRIEDRLTDEDIVVEGIYDKAELRRSLANVYKGHGRVCIWLDTPIEMKRTRKHYSKYCEYTFEPPTYNEGWDEIIIIRGEEEIRLQKGEENGEYN